MNRKKYSIKKLTLLSLPFWLTIGVSCNSEYVEPGVATTYGVPAYVEIQLNDLEVYGTRATRNSYDGWSIATFSDNDVVGMYSLAGRQNPDSLEDFSLPVWNEEMYFEGRTGNNYRFGNSEITLDPPKVSGQYSWLYYPYLKEMPDPNVYKPTDLIKGIDLRVNVADTSSATGYIEKCQDIMSTSSSYITLTEGVLKPSFKHYCVNLVLQRGAGFKNAEDKQVWVVMRNPYTDIRVTRQQYTNGMGQFQYTLQYLPEEGEEVMGKIWNDQPSFNVNKYAVWQAWNGQPYKGMESQYVMIPPAEVMFILIQDDYKKWHTVTDFYLSGTGSKSGSSGYRYVLNIALEGLDVVVRPVTVENWDEELTITDNRTTGIHDPGEYVEWVTAYNTYVKNERKGEDIIKMLRNFGDGIQYGERMDWTFYINNDIDFENSGELPMISSLEDILEGSSTYTNYTLSNVKGDLIDKMSSTGILRALDFKGLYVVQPNGKNTPFGALANEIDHGMIENVNINNGVVIGNGVTGMLAGTITNGTIKNCTFSGDVIGEKSYDGPIGGESRKGLFGVINGEPILIDVRITGLKFIEKR